MRCPHLSSLVIHQASKMPEHILQTSLTSREGYRINAYVEQK